MNRAAMFGIWMILAAGIVSTAEAQTTIYFDDGSMYELQPGEQVYVSGGVVWEFSRFDSRDMRIEALEPFSLPEADGDCLGFGPGGCAQSSDELSESEKAEMIKLMVQKITNGEG